MSKSIDEVITDSVSVVDRSHLLGLKGPQQFVAGLRLATSLMTYGEKIRALFLLGLMVINAALNILALSSVMPFIYLIIADDPLNGSSLPARLFRFVGVSDADSALFVLGGAVVVLAVTKALSFIFQAWATDSFTSELEVRVATKLLRQITEAPYQWLATKNSAILKELALARTSAWARGSVRMLLQLAGDILFLLLSLSLIVMTSPKEGLIVIASAAILSATLLHICKASLMRYAEEKRLFARRALLSATDAIWGGRDVRISRAGRLLVESFRLELAKFGVAEVKGRIFSTLPRHISEVIGIGALVTLGLAMLASGIPKSEASPILILYALITMRALPVLSQAVGSAATLYSHFPAVAELHDFATEIGQLTPKIDRAPLTTLNGWQELVFQDVGFSYPDAASKALGDVSFTLRRGDRLGIVGASGAGKSTLVDIFVGLLHPNEGSVVIDGARLTGELERAWQAQIGYVAQLPYLVDGTLLDNVTLGAVEVAEREIRCLEALQAAGLKQLVDALPQGIYARSGDVGSKLSGGQRQRVAIARALYRNASCLVLDEATSALDSVTEQEVIDGVFDLGRDVTVVIIAHRLSLVQRCDRIALLDKGRLVAIGTHAQLMEHSEIYQTLVGAQSIDA